MRIVFFTDTYHPQINGVVSAIDAFAAELRKRGHDVHIFCPRDKILKPSVNIHTLPSLKFRPYPEYKIGLPSWRILNILKKFKPDIVHIHTPGPVGVIGIAIARMLRLPTIAHYHTLISEYIRYFTPATSINAIKKIDTAIVNRYTKWFYNHANLVLVPGNSMKKFLLKVGVATPITVIPNGIKVPALRKKSHNKIPIILHVGRICREKSIDVVVRAFSELLKNMDARLIITSRGPAEQEIKSLVRGLGIGDKVIFTGYISEKEKQKLYRRADVFALASTTETQGLVALEAMISGTPVVAAARGGTMDYIADGKTGLTFHPGNYRELARKLAIVLSNKNVRHRIVKGGLKVARSLSIETVTKNLEQIYKLVTEEKISIVIPTYFEENYIVQTLKALHNQTYKNFETIIVDSNSKDRTIKLAKPYADKIIVIKKRGIGLARNIGAKASSGGIILFLDADTILEKKYLEKVLRYFRQPSVVGVSGYLSTYGKLVDKIVFKLCAETAWMTTLIGNPLFYGMCMAWRKDMFNKAGSFNTTLDTAEDIDLTIRMSRLGRCILARDARAITSPRRTAEMGTLTAVAFHIINFFRYVLLRRASRAYPVAR